ISVMSLPMPMIMSAMSCRLTARVSAIHRGAHGLDGIGKPGEDRLSDQEVTDIKLHDLRECRDDLGRVEIETMPGMDLQPEPPGLRNTIADALQFGGGFRRMSVD